MEQVSNHQILDSRDGTAETVRHCLPQMNERLHIVRRETNRGGGIATGYEWRRDHEVDPADLPALLNPVVSGEVDYAKGNRLFTGDAWNQIPKVRYLGNSGMSLCRV